MSRRVVILSPGGSFLDDLLPLLRERRAEVQAVVVYDARLSRARAGSAMARLRTAGLVPLRWAWRRFRRRAPHGFAPVVLTGALNGGGTARALRRLAPDVIVLARCGLVRPHLLAIPGDGVVNVHPGLLPWIRGNSPVGNSLLRGVPLGATAFRVDAGIDTGPILRRRLAEVAGGETEAGLKDALYRLWLEMTVDVIEAATASALPAGTSQRERFPLCRDLAEASELPAVADAVRRDTARTLLERWRPLCDPADLTLPASADAEFLPRAAR